MSDSKRRIGILGGSFDPIHFGHIKPSLALAKQYQLHNIHLLPCKVSPFKENTYASSMHRWNMVRMIAENNNVFIADARELERDAPSYTYTTLCELSEEFGNRFKVFWIIGADALSDFPAWYEVDQIMQMCHVLVLRRPGYKFVQSEEKMSWLNKYLCEDIKQLELKDSGHIYITETEMLEISSTNIRKMIQAGEQPTYILPGGVWSYIRRNKLYINN